MMPLIRYLAGSFLVIAGSFALGYFSQLDKYPAAQKNTPFEISPTNSFHSQHSGLSDSALDTDTEAALRNRLKQVGDHADSEAKYDDVLNTLLKWAATNPQAALEYVCNHYDPRHRNAFLSSILTEWAHRDGRAALDWTTKNLPHDFTQYDAVLSAVGKDDPDTAWRYAGELAAKEDRANAQSIYVSALRGIVYSGNFTQASALIANLQTLPAGGKYDLSSFLAGQWGLYNPAQAAQWASTLPDDGSLNRGQTLVSLGVAWAQSDPQAAADFAIRLQPGVARQNMLATSLGSWAADHPDQAAQWLNENQGNPDLNLVVRSLASSSTMIDTNPQEAIDWANTIKGDNPVRIQALTIIMNRWMGNDPASVENYLNTSTDLSPETIQIIRQNMNTYH
jgi:hypothetical protein